MASLISKAYVGGVVNNAVSTAVQIFPTPSILNAGTNPLTNVQGPAILAAPGGNKLNGQYFKIVVCGSVSVGGATPTVALGLYANIAPTVPTLAAPGTLIATLAAATLVTSTTYNWRLEAVLEGDSLSGIVGGSFLTSMNNVLVGPAALGTKLTAVPFGPTGTPPNVLPNDPCLQFVFGLTFGVANAANTSTLLQFSLEA